jgi:hypothetical protein
MGFSVIVIQTPPQHCWLGGLSENCVFLQRLLSHAERVFQITSFREGNLLEVRLFHQEFLMN